MTEPSQSLPTRFPADDSCDLVAHLLSPHVDGLLSAPLRVAVEEHLESCPTCASQLSALERLVSALGDLPPVEIGASFDEGVAHRLRVAGRRVSPLQATALVAAGLMVAGLLVGGGWWLGTHTRGAGGAGGDLATPSAPAGPEAGEPLTDRGGSDRFAPAGPGGELRPSGEAAGPGREGGELAEGAPAREELATEAPSSAEEALASTPVDRPVTGPAGLPGEAVAPDGQAPGREQPAAEDSALAMVEEPTAVGEDGVAIEVTLAEPPTDAGVRGGHETRVPWGAGRHLDRAAAAVAAGNLAQAVKDFTRAIRGRRWAFEDEVEQAYMGRGDALMKLGRPEAAVRDYRDTIRLVAARAFATSDSIERASIATDSICRHLGVALRAPPVGAVDRLTDTQLRRFVAELRRRLPLESSVDGDPDVAVGRVSISQAGLAEIALEKIALDLRTYMVRYPDHFEIEDLTLEDR